MYFKFTFSRKFPWSWNVKVLVCKIIYARSVNYALVLDMSEILNNIYIWVILVNSESVLLLALVKYMLCSHFTQNCIFLYLLEDKNPYFVTKNCWKSSSIFVFILSKKRCNWFQKSIHNSGMVVPRMLSDPPLNRIFNALSTGAQYTLSFQWTNLAWCANWIFVRKLFSYLTWAYLKK